MFQIKGLVISQSHVWKMFPDGWVDMNMFKVNNRQQAINNQTYYIWLIGLQESLARKFLISTSLDICELFER